MRKIIYEVGKMKRLEDKIRAEGKALSETVLKVDGFINHQVDPVLMSEIGKTFAAYYKDKKSDKELLYMAMIDIALRHEREMQRNDTQPYDKIMSDLTREIEDALDDKIDENK